MPAPVAVPGREIRSPLTGFDSGGDHQRLYAPWDDANTRPLLFHGNLPTRDSVLPKALNDNSAGTFSSPGIGHAVLRTHRPRPTSRMSHNQTHTPAGTAENISSERQRWTYGRRSPRRVSPSERIPVVPFDVPIAANEPSQDGVQLHTHALARALALRQRRTLSRLAVADY